MISGRVVDRFTGAPLMASVSAGAGMTTANGSGYFSLFASPGVYTLNIFYSGYESFSTTVSASSGDVDLGTIRLSPIFQAL
jgi:hypothetical protein